MEKKIKQVQKYYKEVRDYLDSLIVGEKAAKDVIASAMLCDKNCRILLTGPTGAAKTLLAKFLSENFNSGRISISSDLLPSDIQNQLRDSKDVNYLLLEEFNRASGKVQSSLVEFLAENQMTIDNETTPFGDFYVVATQNDKEIAGIFNVPHAIYDRFDINVPFGNLTREEKDFVLFDYKKPIPKEINIQEIVNFTSASVNEFKDNLSPIDKKVLGNIFYDIIDAQKYKGESLFAGTNIRAHAFAIKLAIFHAFTVGHDYIMPDDVVDYITNVYLHRVDQTLLKMTSNETLSRMNDIKKKVLEDVKRPTKF